MRNINIDKGIKLVKKALELIPNNPAFLDSLGWGYFKKGNYKKAYKYIREAYKLMPEDPVLTEHYADVLVKLGNLKKAIKLYKLALEIIQKTKKEGEPNQKKRILEKLKNLGQKQ